MSPTAQELQYTCNFMLLSLDSADRSFVSNSLSIATVYLTLEVVHDRRQVTNSNDK